MNATSTPTPRDRLAALADDGRFVEHERHARSSNLARYGIDAQEDDGIVAASLAIGGRAFEAVAQDPRFLGGSVGERHGMKLASAIARAVAAGRPFLVLAASAGVRLHEANGGELALGRALKGLCDARAGGLPTFAIGVGDVFGGMSVFAAACGALALVPEARFGLSGPQVIALARGRGELDPTDRAAVAALFGAPARARDGIVEIVDHAPASMRAWIAARDAAAVPFAEAMARAQARLAAAAPPVGAGPTLTVDGPRAVLAPFVGDVAAQELIGVDAALRALPHGVATLVIVEHSRGHAASVAAERVALSRYFAHHALVLAGLRARGVAIVGVVDGVGHSAAFFANALQADRLYASRRSRIVAMEPPALARITGMDPRVLARAIEDDPQLGHPARHFAALGGLELVDAVNDAR